MRILLTNDDGIRAPGIIALFEALIDVEGRYGGPIAGPATEIFTVAPLTVQSGTGHGVTFHRPLMVHEIEVNPRMRGLAVDARPADCVKLAVSNLWPDRFGKGSRPDLVISGMNAGANCGINVIYSGTVAAALEGAFLGLPSIAVSLHLGQGRARFDVAASRARQVIQTILASGELRAHDCLSVNIPVTESGGPMPAVRVCGMNTHGLIDKYERRTSPEGQLYYWPAGHGLDFKGMDKGSDVEHLLRRAITVTPLSYDLTRPGHVELWGKHLRKASQTPEGEIAAGALADSSPLDQAD